jgi:hypothetical protein
MKSKVILTALGSDRPGLTQSLAEAVFAAGGNWLESHLSHLGGQYVGSILVELDSDAVPALERRSRASMRPACMFRSCRLARRPRLPALAWRSIWSGRTAPASSAK